MINTLDDILSGPTTINGILFQYVRPIIDNYLEKASVKPIDNFYDPATLQKIQEESAEAIMLAIRQALPAFYDAQNLFSAGIRPQKRASLVKTEFKIKEQFYEAYTAFARALIERNTSALLDDSTLKVLQKLISFDAVKAGLVLDKPLWIGAITGNTTLTSQYPVVLEVVRIKHPVRVGAKYARYLCEGILEAKQFEKCERIGLSKKAIETFGWMHTAGLRTPFNLENAGLDLAEFLFYRSQITDVLGVTYIARTRELATQLLGDLQADTPRGPQRRYPLHLATGYVLKQYKVKQRYCYSYKQAYCIDNHITTGAEPRGNNNIFATMIPNQIPPTHYVLIDIGFYGLADYIVDRVGGIGSHLRHEASKNSAKQRWPRKLQQLDRVIAHAISDLMEHVDVYQFPLFEGGLR